MVEAGIQFDAQDAYNLLVHYTDGDCPLNGEVKMIGQHPMLGMLIGFMVESDEWETAEELHIRYDGKRIATWKKGDGDMQYAQRNETPKRQ